MKDYQRYLASREWAVRREVVRARSGGRCERCIRRPMNAVHHLTYERIGRESLEDLQAICNVCHAFLSGKTEYDPLENEAKWIANQDGVDLYLSDFQYYCVVEDDDGNEWEYDEHYNEYHKLEYQWFTGYGT